MATDDRTRPAPTGPGRLPWSLAEALGAVQEARRLGAVVVGTEHVLMATFADPTVRCALAEVGADMRAVQPLVEAAGARRARRRPDDDAGLTPLAAEVVVEVGVDPSRPDDVVIEIDRTRALRAAMTWFLGSERDSAARAVLDELGVVRYRTRLVTALRTPPPPDDLPRPRPPS